MNLHELKATEGSSRRRKRVGRGMRSGKGKTSGKGHKGQMARTGHKHKPTFEGGQNRFVTSVPRRGFNNYTRVAYHGVNLSSLNVFEDGSDVDTDAIFKAGLANGPKGTLIKVLGTGDINVKLNVKAHAFSKSAIEKIEKAGGTCEVVK